MPLSELLYLMANEKLDSSEEKNPTSDLPFVPENDFGELVWENGQIQSSKARKIQTSNGLSSQTFKIRDKDGNNNNKMGKFGTMGMELNEMPSSVPSVEMGLDQDNDMVPWLNYPIVEPLQHDFCSEFLPELSGVTVNESSSQSNFASLDRPNNGNQSIRDSHTVSGDVPKVCSAVEGEATRSRTSSNDVYSSSTRQCQASFPYFRSRPLTNNSDSISNGTHHAISGHSVRAPASGSFFPSLKMPKQVPGPSTNNPSLMNSSHFTKPVSVVKANLQNMSVKVGSGISSVERLQSKDKGLITSSSNLSGSPLNDSYAGLQKERSAHCHPVAFSSKVDAKPLETMPAEVSVPAERSEAVSKDEDSRNDKCCHQNADESVIKGLVDVEKPTEPVVACSSVCSGNSVERASDDPAQNLKRKHRDTEESEGPSDDIEEESVGAKKGAHARVGLGSKRSRAAEVHNLSERRRRDRINEKMRALQELIPNCNKVDKASMLDEAIEYLKTLQLQVQIMSMGAGLYMPSMMYPGMPHMHAGHMTQFLPMGVGMGMGYGIGMPDMNVGSSGCSMYQVPPMQAAHFPAPPMPGPTAVPGSGGSNLQLFGLPGQGFPMPFARAPLVPMPGGPLLKANAEPNAGRLVSHMDNLDSAPGSSSKDSVQNINSEVMQNNVSSPSMNHQTSSQLHASNDCFEHSASVQSNGQASEAMENGALKSANGDASIRATGGCD